MLVCLNRHKFEDICTSNQQTYKGGAEASKIYMTCPRNCPNPSFCSQDRYRTSPVNMHQPAPYYPYPTNLSPGWTSATGNSTQYWTPPHYSTNFTPDSFRNTFQSISNPHTHLPPEPPILRQVVPLGNASGPILNGPPPMLPAQPNASKRKRAPKSNTARKRANNQTQSPNIQLPTAGPSSAVFGVGPPTSSEASASSSSSSAASGSQPRVFYTSKEEPGKGRTLGATDVWYFMRGLVSDARPATLPSVEIRNTTQPSREKFAHLGCVLCKCVLSLMQSF